MSVKTVPATRSPSSPSSAIRPARRRRRAGRIDQVLAPLLTLAGVIATWWLAVRAFDLPTILLPAPDDVAAALTEHHRHLAGEAISTVGHTLGGFGVAVAGGLSVAVLLATSSLLRRCWFPLLVALQAVPKVALAPLLVVWLGFGPSSKIMLVALLCFFPVLVSTLAGLSAAPAETIELARSLTASRWRTLVKIRIWYALPGVFTGLKVAMSLALIGAVVAQITTPNSGLGAIIVRSGQAANTSLAFAAVVLLAGIGITLYYSLVGLERAMLPWAKATTA